MNYCSTIGVLLAVTLLLNATAYAQEHAAVMSDPLPAAKIKADSSQGAAAACVPRKATFSGTKRLNYRSVKLSSGSKLYIQPGSTSNGKSLTSRNVSSPLTFQMET